MSDVPTPDLPEDPDEGADTPADLPGDPPHSQPNTPPPPNEGEANDVGDGNEPA